MNMRTIYLSFETAFALASYYAAYYTFSLFFRHNVYDEQPDYGTVIGGLLFLAFAVLTTVMLTREFGQLMQQRAAAMAVAQEETAQERSQLPQRTTPASPGTLAPLKASLLERHTTSKD